MSGRAYEILDRLRAEGRLTDEELGEVVAGAADGTWTDPQLGAFLMGAARGAVGIGQTAALTEAMLDSGDRWRLGDEVALLADKHSTGGVGDKVSLIFAPLLAEAGYPVAMLTGRGLGHTGGTADKLESIPGLSVVLDRAHTLDCLRTVGMAIGIATDRIAPADRVLYRLRDETGTVDSLPLITASILSKKLAAGARALVLDIKTGSGAFMAEPERAAALAHLLTETATDLGCPTTARVTDMSQPLGRWVGNACEVLESLSTLEGRGPKDLVDLTCALAADAMELLGEGGWDPERFRRLLASGAPRERFLRWARAQGADQRWVTDPTLHLAPVKQVATAPRSGVVAAVDTRRIGLLLAAAGGGRSRPGSAIDHRVSLRCEARLADRVEVGTPLATLWLREETDSLVTAVTDCFSIEDGPFDAPTLLLDRFAAR